MQILAPPTLFSHLLLDSDPGNISPNPMNEFQLADIGFKTLTEKFLASSGCFYKWTQLLAGIEYPKAEPGTVQEVIIQKTTAQTKVSKKTENGYT